MLIVIIHLKMFLITGLNLERKTTGASSLAKGSPRIQRRGGGSSYGASPRGALALAQAQEGVFRAEVYFADTVCYHSTTLVTFTTLTFS